MKIILVAIHVGSLSTGDITLGHKKGSKTSWLELGHSRPRTYFTIVVGSLSQKRKQTPITGREEGRASEFPSHVGCVLELPDKDSMRNYS